MDIGHLVVAAYEAATYGFDAATIREQFTFYGDCFAVPSEEP